MAELPKRTVIRLFYFLVTSNKKKRGKCNMKKLIILSIALCLVTPAFALAAILNVPEEYGTIQSAVNAATDGDKIVVAAGNYAGAVIRKSLELESSGAIIDGLTGNSNTGFQLIGSGADGSKISQFAFQNVRFGIVVLGVDDLSLTHNTMGDEYLSQGITITSFAGNRSERALVSHNLITDFQTTGQGSGGVGMVTFQTKNAMIKHNKITTHDKLRNNSWKYIFGVVVLNSEGTMVSQNKIQMEYGQTLTSAVNIGLGCLDTIVSFNDFRGTLYDFFDAGAYPNMGPGPETTAQRNFSNGPEIAADNRGEGHTDVRPSEVLPHGDVVVAWESES